MQRFLVCIVAVALLGGCGMFKREPFDYVNGPFPSYLVETYNPDTGETDIWEVQPYRNNEGKMVMISRPVPGNKGILENFDSRPWYGAQE